MNGTLGGASREGFLYFVRCINEGRRPDIITSEQSMEAVRTTLAAEESAATGKVVMLE